jgi:hypothetical protein
MAGSMFHKHDRLLHTKIWRRCSATFHENWGRGERQGYTDCQAKILVSILQARGVDNYEAKHKSVEKFSRENLIPGKQRSLMGSEGNTWRQAMNQFCVPKPCLNWILSTLPK